MSSDKRGDNLYNVMTHLGGGLPRVALENFVTTHNLIELVLNAGKRDQIW